MIELDNDAELLGFRITFTDNSGVLANLSSASLHINTSLLPDLIFQ